MEQDQNVMIRLKYKFREAGPIKSPIHWGKGPEEKETVDPYQHSDLKKFDTAVLVILICTIKNYSLFDMIWRKQ